MQYPQNRTIEPLAAALEHRQGHLTHPAELATAVSIHPSWVEMLGTYWPYVGLALWVVVSVVLIVWLTEEPLPGWVAAELEESETRNARLTGDSGPSGDSGFSSEF